MLNRYFGQDYIGAERFADEYAGDTGEPAYVVEVFDIPGEYERGTLRVIGAETRAEWEWRSVDYETQYDATRATDD